MSTGFFVFQKEFFEYLGADDCILEREPLERLASEGQLMAYQHDGFFYAMDTYREYQHLNELWNRRAAPWKLWDDVPARLPRLVNSRGKRRPPSESETRQKGGITSNPPG